METTAQVFHGPSIRFGARDNALSAIRLIATLLIFFCHILEQIGVVYEHPAIGYLGNYLSVGVPIFLILSGYLYGQRSYETSAERLRMYGRTRRVLLDYEVYVVIVIIPLYLCVSRSAVTLKAVLYTLLGNYSLTGLAHFWYIPYILLCYLITPLLYDLKIRMRRTSRGRLSLYLAQLAVLAALCGMLLAVYDSHFAPTYILCYMAGYFLPDVERWPNRSFSKKRILCLLAVPCLLANAFTIYFRYVLQLSIDAFGRIPLRFVYGIAHGMLGLELFLLLYVIFQTLNTRASTRSIGARLLQWSDQYSFDFYITHMLYVKGYLSLIGLLGNAALETALSLGLTVLSAVLLRKLSAFIAGLGKNLLQRKV